jgi:hypothetical protein
MIAGKTKGETVFGGWLADHAEQMPLLRNRGQGEHAAILKRYAGSGNEVVHGP